MMEGWMKLSDEFGSTGLPKDPAHRWQRGLHGDDGDWNSPAAREPHKLLTAAESRLSLSCAGMHSLFTGVLICILRTSYEVTQRNPVHVTAVGSKRTSIQVGEWEKQNKIKRQ